MCSWRRWLKIGKSFLPRNRNIDNVSSSSFNIQNKLDNSSNLIKYYSSRLLYDIQSFFSFSKEKEKSSIPFVVCIK